MGLNMRKQEIFYYSERQNDEFVASPKSVKPIKGDYKYIEQSRGGRILAFVAYRLIATPLAFIYSRILKGQRYINRRALKPLAKTGYFVYANHTQVLSDALTPSIVLWPKKNYAIVNASNVSLPGLGNATKLLGALPLPEDMQSSKNFLKAIETRIGQGHSILIYPEAHVWPFYTKIRPFDDRSFIYPAIFNTPVFTMTTTYQKKKRGFKTVIYIDGPFEAPADGGRKVRQAFLHQRALEALNGRAELSNYEKHIYLPKEKR